MGPLARFSQGRKYLIALVGGALMLGGVVTSQLATASQPAAAGAGQAARTASIGAARAVHPQTSTTAFVPTAAQVAARDRAMAGLATHKAPSLGRTTKLADVNTANPGPATAVGKLAPSDYSTIKRSPINSVCGGAGCGVSSIMEPTVANNGRYIVATMNWSIAYSTNGAAGATAWASLNPYSFDAAFCCDQMVTYDAGRNIFLLLQLAYAGEGNAGNGLDLSIASGATPTTWCTYHIPGATGGGATDTPDYPKIALDNNFAFLTWNDYPPNAGWARTGLARLPLDALATCAGTGFTFITRSDDFTFGMSQAASSLDQYYWVSNWYTDNSHTNGASIRIFSWGDNTNTYFFNDRAVNAYTFGTVACGSPDWCSRLDPRFETVSIFRAEYRGQANASFAGDSILEISTQAGPSGFSGGKNYVVYNYFKLNSLTYLGNDQTYNPSLNFAYAGCAPNVHGYVGCAMSFGTNVPGGLVLIKDYTTPLQAWANVIVLPGKTGAGGWGDYTITSVFNPAVGPFQTVLWLQNGATAHPYYFVFGRVRELSAYTRWKNK